MQLNDGGYVRLEITGVHEGEAALVAGQLAFKPNRRGRPELATRALIDGQVRDIEAPRLNSRSGFYEARVLS